MTTLFIENLVIEFYLISYVENFKLRYAFKNKIQVDIALENGLMSLSGIFILKAFLLKDFKIRFFINLTIYINLELVSFSVTLSSHNHT